MGLHPEILDDVDVEELRQRQIAALVGVLQYAIETSDTWGDVRDLPIHKTINGASVSRPKTIIGHKPKKPVIRMLATPNPELMVRGND